MKFQNKHLAISAFVIVSAVVLPGCAWWPFGDARKANSSSSEALLTINGETALTVAEYEEQLEMARKDNPQIDMFLQMMPNAEKDFVFPGMSTAKLMKAWVHKKGIDNTEEFKKQRQQLHEAMDLQLNMKHFDDAHPIVITDADLEAFYEEKKDVIPALTLSAGGVEILYVRFESKDKAEKFLEKSKEVRKAEAFKALAHESKLQAGDSVVNQKSALSTAVKNAAFDIKKFPSVHMVKSEDGSYLVFLATGKSETKYRDLKTPEVQQGLKKMASDERKEKQIKAVVEELKKELNVVENTKYFEDKENAKKALMSAEASVQSEDTDSAVNSVKA